MLGNWSLGDYFKKEQLPWFFEYLTDVVGLDPNKLFVTCSIGFPEFNIPRDTESAEIWKELFGQKGVSAKEVDLGTEEAGYELGEQGGRSFFTMTRIGGVEAGNHQVCPSASLVERAARFSTFLMM